MQPAGFQLWENIAGWLMGHGDASLRNNSMHSKWHPTSYIGSNFWPGPIGCHLGGRESLSMKGRGLFNSFNREYLTNFDLEWNITFKTPCFLQSQCDWFTHFVALYLSCHLKQNQIPPSFTGEDSIYTHNLTGKKYYQPQDIWESSQYIRSGNNRWLMLVK